MKPIVVLILILLLASYLRFYHLMFDAPYFFNPDERNMAGAITQFRLPNRPADLLSCLTRAFSLSGKKSDTCTMNPHFFAYGQFPLYLSFVSDQITQPFHQTDGKTNQPSILMTEFPSAIFWLRFWSAAASIGSIWILYRIGVLVSASRRIGLLIAILGAFLPTSIQSAHFGTTESLLTFFYLCSVYLALAMASIPLTNRRQFLRYAVLSSLVIGLASGTKLTGLFCLAPIGCSFIFRFLGLIRFPLTRTRILEFITLLGTGILILGLSSMIFLVSSPFSISDPEHFWGAVFGYEADVATGRYDAFYTKQFKDTVPILFQATHVFPFTLGWPVFISGCIGLSIMLIQRISYAFLPIKNRIKRHVFRLPAQAGIKDAKRQFEIHHTYYLILTASFFIYLLPNSFLYAKWTRFLSPIYPFFVLFAVFGITRLLRNRKPTTWFSAPGNLIMGVFCIACILPGTAFISIYAKPDSRLQASIYLYQTVPSNTTLLSETANVVDIPLGINKPDAPLPSNLEIVSFDFYHVDQDPALAQKLPVFLAKSDYILIPSRRIFYNYRRLKEEYPIVNRYYDALFSGTLGFEEIRNISSFPTLNFGRFQIEWNDESSEETFTVFDHPVIRIYRKTTQRTPDDYRRILIQQPASG